MNASTPAWAVAHKHFKVVAWAVVLLTGKAAWAQPVGPVVVHGQASIAAVGNQLTVTTQNGAGSTHSALDWQSFSVPQGHTTRFQQPTAASTSINRVTGADPSAIFGNLTSNGRLVLVSPAGITVGAGAVVDTAGFTASTLRMSDADALAGRLRFGDGSAAGPLAVDGRVIARLGDVVLIASHVSTGNSAVVQALDGAVIIAAGQRIELTGRGLEGIRLELAAPTDTAVNLGTLQGDAVGMFASRLRHSGLIQANGAHEDGNKLQLVSTHSRQVDGLILTSSPALLLKDGGDEDDGKGEDEDEDDDKGKKTKPKGKGSATPAPAAPAPVASAPPAAPPPAATALPAGSPRPAPAPSPTAGVPAAVQAPSAPGVPATAGSTPVVATGVAVGGVTGAVNTSPTTGAPVIAGSGSTVPAAPDTQPTTGAASTGATAALFPTSTSSESASRPAPPLQALDANDLAGPATTPGQALDPGRRQERFAAIWSPRRALAKADAAGDAQDSLQCIR